MFFPKNCAVCHQTLVAGENAVCFKCLFALPKTNLHLQIDNEVEKRFWGKVPIGAATAFFQFEKGSAAQTLLHELKYRDNQDVGVELGKFLASDLSASPRFQDIDYVVPVPLHEKKLRKRGYNQSECIAEGISAVLQVPMNADNLYRAVETQTQTRKSVFERWENTKDIFLLKNKEIFADKHILLVDDVLTTGSTIEASVHAVLTAENAKISVVTLAVA